MSSNFSDLPPYACPPGSQYCPASPLSSWRMPAHCPSLSPSPSLPLSLAVSLYPAVPLVLSLSCSLSCHRALSLSSSRSLVLSLSSSCSLVLALSRPCALSRPRPRPCTPSSDFHHSRGTRDRLLAHSHYRSRPLVPSRAAMDPTNPKFTRMCNCREKCGGVSTPVTEDVYRKHRKFRDDPAGGSRAGAQSEPRASGSGMQHRAAPVPASGGPIRSPPSSPPANPSAPKRGRYSTVSLILLAQKHATDLLIHRCRRLLRVARRLLCVVRRPLRVALACPLLLLLPRPRPRSHQRRLVHYRRHSEQASSSRRRPDMPRVERELRCTVMRCPTHQMRPIPR